MDKKGESQVNSLGIWAQQDLETFWGRAQEQRPTFEQGGASREDNVREKGAPQVHVRLLDGKHQHLVDALALLADQVWPEQKLRCPESGRTNLQGGGQASEVGLGMEEAPVPTSW